MRPQRNNIARGIRDEHVKRLISSMLYKGYLNREIVAEVQRQFPGCPKLHDKTFKAWKRSEDYIRYRNACEAIRQETEETRASAQALNDGQGPQNSSDIILMETLRLLREKIRAGEVTDLHDIGAVTKALAPLMRAQTAQELADSRRREADLAAEMTKLKEEHATALGAKDAEIARLQKRLEAAAATTGAMDPQQRREVMNAVNEFVGGKAT